MNRQQFMKELERLLQDIPENERREALQYYNDYFDDAGVEKEADIIRELGSPEQVAHTIREGMTDPAPFTPSNAAPPKKDRNPWKAVCIILLILLLSPVVIPIGLAILAVLAAVVIGIIGLIIGVVATGIALLIAGAAVIGYGIYKLFLIPAVGIALGGIGCLLFGIGILVSLFISWVCVKVFPAIIRGMVRLIQIPFRKAGVNI